MEVATLRVDMNQVHTGANNTNSAELETFDHQVNTLILRIITILWVYTSFQLI